MIPNTSEILQSDIEVAGQPSYTFKLDNDSVRGYVDELEAVKQAIYKALLTERYQYVMYSGDYGIETLDLYGQPASYVCAELERRVTEALVCDDRIESVSDFEFDLSKRGSVRVKFNVKTIFGDAAAERTVNY